MLLDFRNNLIQHELGYLGGQVEQLHLIVSLSLEVLTHCLF